MKKEFKYRNANGQRGIVLRSHDGSPYLFRIYEEGGEFKDYQILYDDLGVVIEDNDAEFLESLDGTEFYLDYSRKVLGQEAKYNRVEEGGAETNELANPFKEGAEHFTRLRNEKPTAEQVRSIFEKERPIKSSGKAGKRKKD